ncbi:MAG: T9SS type A sorting domain-containing protein [Ignavibacteriae bacterium]|nr:T9SS type A sorting domain-containing protein [Ignavibacteriota bacterium]
MKKLKNLSSENIKIILTVLFLINSIPGNLNSQWIQQKLPVNSGVFISMDISSNGNGMLGGWQFENEITGRLYRSNSNRTSWNPVILPDSVRAVTGIKMINDSLGYICGAYNLFESNSLIRNLLIFGKDINPDIPGYSSRSGMTGLGNNKAIFLRSINGGENWEPYGRMNPVYDYLTTMSFKDQDNGVAVASIQYPIFFQSKMIKTTNGGLDWNELNIPVILKNINSILYSDKNVIFAAGRSHYNNGIIVSSTDEGNTWVQNIYNEVYTFNKINFINSTTGFVSAILNSSYPISQIYKTTNSGSTWNPLETTFDSIVIQENNFDIESGIGYIFCNRTIQNDPLFWDFTNLIIGKTNDYGESWQITEFSDYKSLFCSKITDTNEIFAAGGYMVNNLMEGYLLHTTNGGLVPLYNEIREIPATYKLYQNFPNPFNPSTTIRFDVSGNSDHDPLNVKLTVYNYLGKAVKYLVDSKFSSGSYDVKFDGNDLPSGIYFYTINIGNFTETKKMILVK